MTGTHLVRWPGLAVAAGLLAASGLAGQGAWTNNGPPVEVTSLAVSATGTVFAGGRDGLYRSVDHGETWSRVGPPFPPTSFGAPALAVDPNSGNTLYIALERGNGIFKSTDGGQTRTRLSAGLPADPEPFRLVVAPSDPSTIYLLGRGIFRSSDAGASWV
jgi:photosystem II stability/assembly factor-like uncharacterized protein